MSKTHLEELKKDFTFGGLGHRDGLLLLLLREEGLYGVPKGHADPEDKGDERATVARELREETSWKVEVHEPLGVIERLGRNAKGKFVKKFIKMYRVALLEHVPQLVQEEQAIFVAPDEAMRNMLPEEAAFLQEHLAQIMTPNAPAD